MKLFLVALLAVFFAQQQGPRAGLEGTIVRHGNGQPIPKAKVTLTRQRGAPVSQPVAPVISDDKGKFSFSGLEEGRYDLVVQADGYVGEPSLIALSTGEVIKDLTIDMTAVANVSGRIRDASEQPLVNVPVQLLRSAYDSSGRKIFKSSGVAHTNDRGEYRMYWVPPGRYYLLAGRPSTGADPVGAMLAQAFAVVTASGNEVAPVESYAFYPGVTDFRNARLLDLQSAADLHIDLVMTPKPRTFSIRGKVLDSRTGQPPASASVFLWTDTPGSVSADADGLAPGRFYDAATGNLQIRDVLPGTYTLGALVQDGARARQGGPPPALAVATAQAAVTGSDVDGIALSVVPAGSIQGRLRLEGQFPANITVDRFRVTAIPTGGSTAFQQMLQMRIAMATGFSPPLTANADGTFHLTNIFPGDYRIEVTLGPARMPYGVDGYLKEARFEATDILSSALRFSTTSSGTLDLVVASGTGKITGAVQDARSQVVTNARVVIVPDRARLRPELYQQGVTDESGQFTVSGVAPGDYRVFSWESLEEYSWFDPEVLARYETRGAAVRVSGSTTATVSVRTIPAEGTQQ